MAYIPRSSFIPKETAGAIPLKVRQKHTVHVFSMLATIILVLSLAGVAGTYLYTQVLTKRLEVVKQALSKVSTGDNEKKMEEIKKYDEKLTIGKNLLENHKAASRVLEELENSTKETIQFTNFKYSYDPGFEAKLTLEGNTEEFSSVALQKMQLIEDALFSDFAVRDISTGVTVSTEETINSEADDDASDEGRGDVTFTVSGIFDKGLLDYTGSGTRYGDASEPLPPRGAPVSTSTSLLPRVATTSSQIPQ